MRSFVLILFAMVFQCSTATVGELNYINFASCTGVIDTVDFTLEFFEEIEVEGREGLEGATGK